LILYPATLPDSLISCNRFSVESIRFHAYKITLSTRRDYFTSFFSIWMPLFLFVLVTTSTIPYFPTLCWTEAVKMSSLVRIRQKNYSLLTFNMNQLSAGFSHMALMLKKCSSIFHLPSIFIMKEYWILLCLY
jgi:hypothetical protein